MMMMSKKGNPSYAIYATYSPLTGDVESQGWLVVYTLEVCLVAFEEGTLIMHPSPKPPNLDVQAGDFLVGPLEFEVEIHCSPTRSTRHCPQLSTDIDLSLPQEVPVTDERRVTQLMCLKCPPGGNEREGCGVVAQAMGLDGLGTPLDILHDMGTQVVACQ
jgi:hypothetical protein